MTWNYMQKTGGLSHNDIQIASGYSGNTTGLNNPDEQDKIGVGPIPRGEYTIGPPHRPINHLGPDALPLYPAASNDMQGRCGFFIHGDNWRMDHTASDGCIIMGPATRKAVIESKDAVLVVLSGE